VDASLSLPRRSAPNDHARRRGLPRRSAAHDHRAKAEAAAPKRSARSPREGGACRAEAQRTITARRRVDAVLLSRRRGRVELIEIRAGHWLGDAPRAQIVGMDILLLVVRENVEPETPIAAMAPMRLLIGEHGANAVEYAAASRRVDMLRAATGTLHA